MFADRMVVIFLIWLFLFIMGSVDGSDIKRVETLVKQWSPLIWLSPNEQFMPLYIEEFLGNMNIADEKGSIVTQNKNSPRFLQYNSKRFFLVPHVSLEKLKSNKTSFIYGRNPKHYPLVPIYAVVTYCDHSISDSIPSFHVTYWMFYPYNEGKDICFLGKIPAPLTFSKCLFGRYRKLGNHIGDWEHMSLSFSGQPYPDMLFLSVHDAGAYYSYDQKNNAFKYQLRAPRKSIAQVPDFPEFIRLQGGHPVLFAAEGSHGLWATPGEHVFMRVPKITDKTGYGTPWKTWAAINFYHIGRTEIPLWMSFKGKWGNPKAKCFLLKKFGICEFTEGPKGLLRENQDFVC